EWPRAVATAASQESIRRDARRSTDCLALLVHSVRKKVVEVTWHDRCQVKHWHTELSGQTERGCIDITGVLRQLRHHWLRHKHYRDPICPRQVSDVSVVFLVIAKILCYLPAAVKQTLQFDHEGILSASG